MKSIVERFLARFASHATLSEVLFKPAGGLAHAVRLINATSDKANSVVAFFTGDAPIALTEAAPDADTTLVVGTTAAATLSANDIIAIFNNATGAIQLRTVSSVSGGTVTVGAGITGAHAIADTQIFKMVAAGTLKLGATTLNMAPDFPITIGRIGRPFLVRVDSTSAGSINHLGVELVE